MEIYKQLLIILIAIIILKAIELAFKSGKNNKDYTKSYTRKELMTKHEKNEYVLIKEVADKLGYTVFTKVRLFDLIKPLSSKDRGAQNKVQAKHVDFVLCNEMLEAAFVIEITDKSHLRKDRSVRDDFVCTALENCGYKVLFTDHIDTDGLYKWLTEDNWQAGPDV